MSNLKKDTRIGFDTLLRKRKMSMAEWIRRNNITSEIELREKISEIESEREYVFLDSFVESLMTHMPPPLPVAPVPVEENSPVEGELTSSPDTAKPKRAKNKSQ